MTRAELIDIAARFVKKGDKISAASRSVMKEYNCTFSYDNFRQDVSKAAKGGEIQNSKVKSKKAEPEPKPEPFVLSAWDFSGDGRMMGIEEYCTCYSLPYADILTYKLVSHTGTPFYNILFRERNKESEVDLEQIREVLNTELTRVYIPKETPSAQAKEGVLKWADLHFGAHIRNLLLTHDYDSDILRNGLLESVNEVNRFGFSKTHIHIHGDLIESLSGLNHINSWMSMDKNQVGANAIMLCTQLLHEAFSQVNNLGMIKIVAGNHDRMSKDNDEDVKGGAAELIAWGLSLMGYAVEFDSYILTHQVDGINYINLHGDKVVSKRTTKDILWKYGIKGCFNFVCEAHLHSLIEKLSVSQRDKFTTITDDGVDHRRMTLPPFFTGNYYSETLGFNSNAGYVIFYDNGKGRPHTFTGSI